LLLRPSFLNFVQNHTDNIILQPYSKIIKKINFLARNLLKFRIFVVNNMFFFSKHSAPPFNAALHIRQSVCFEKYAHLHYSK